LIPSQERGECLWRVRDRRDMVECLRDQRLLFMGDSVLRNMLLMYSELLLGCSTDKHALGPDPEDMVDLCKQQHGMGWAHADYVMHLPPRLGNVTLQFIWTPYSADLLRYALTSDVFSRRAADGGYSFFVIGLGYWDMKNSEGGARAFLGPMQSALNALQSLALPANPELARRLVLLSTPFAEPFEGRNSNMPRAGSQLILDFLREAVPPTGLTFFDTYAYSWVPDELISAFGQRYMTQDGFHPSYSPAAAIMREVLSFWCAALHSGPPAAGAAVHPHGGGAWFLAGPERDGSAVGAFVGSAGDLLLLLGAAGLMTLARCYFSPPKPLVAVGGDVPPPSPISSLFPISP
jgi:hypothetical protein